MKDVIPKQRSSKIVSDTLKKATKVEMIYLIITPTWRAIASSTFLLKSKKDQVPLSPSKDVVS